MLYAATTVSTKPFLRGMMLPRFTSAGPSEDCKCSFTSREMSVDTRCKISPGVYSFVDRSSAGCPAGLNVTGIVEVVVVWVSKVAHVYASRWLIFIYP